MNAIKLLTTILVGLAISACDLDISETSPSSETQSETKLLVAKGFPSTPAIYPASGEAIVAKLGDQDITLSELDSSIRLRLFDLEWRKYQIRKEALLKLLTDKARDNEISQSTANLLLTPPTPPRIDLPETKRPIRGSDHAKVVLDIFCSFQSSHCARLQPVIDQLEQKYQGKISFRFYDYPQKFHRNGLSAANAARCFSQQLSHENPKLWEFQSALYSDINQLNLQRYLDIAEQLGVSSSRYKECLSDNLYKQSIVNDIRTGATLGLGNVPVVFINGLYVKGAKEAETYQHYIDQELQNNDKIKTIEESRLAIFLVATSVSNHADNSTAMIAINELGQANNYRIGAELMPNVNLIDIQVNQIMIKNHGITEYVKLQSSKGHQIADDSNAIPQQANHTKVENAKTGSPKLTKKLSSGQQKTLPLTGKMTLSREWVDNQLLNQSELEKHFLNAEHVVEGVHLIKLNNVENERFYTTLGLKTDDVIMRVNGQWVHEAQNPLWASLQHQESVSLTLVRKGLPFRYDYSIK